MSGKPKSHIKTRDHRNIEFFMVSNAMIDYWSRLTHATFRVYIALCRHCNNGPAEVSYRTICAQLNMSSATVARGLQQLVEEDLIAVERNTDAHGVALSTYTLLPIPDTSLSKVTRDFTDENHPASLTEVTPLQSVKRVKEDEIKEQEKEGVPVRAREIMEQVTRLQAQRTRRKA